MYFFYFMICYVSYCIQLKYVSWYFSKNFEALNDTAWMLFFFLPPCPRFLHVEFLTSEGM